ncbi:piggyBac transposable element-derived protein 4-like [Chelonus insularis]|uniref:piggyBac transposable element-derived protein 4-like n=1 Tax=Chelonus insularis TaxID=460826 RepID=UPI00158A897B|nr:piggyBac transposable element-derived protein 4-like [Chelonus insularis]
MARRIDEDKHKWSSRQPRSQSRRPSRNIVHVRPGPVRSCQNLLDPLQCFSSFITDNMIDLIVTHTNAEIAIKSRKYKAVKSTQRPTNANEIRALIGILPLSAAIKDNHLPSRELFNNTFCGNRYCSTMTCERFDLLINCLRFDDKSTRQERRLTDVFAPFRDIWDLFIAKCRENYKSGCYLTIHKQLLGSRGRCPFHNSTKYMVDAEPYLGSFTKTDGVLLAKGLVKEPYKLTLVGTPRANKREIPVEFQNERTRRTGTASFCYDNELTLLSYKAKPQKVLFLLSTCHEEGTINEHT